MIHALLTLALVLPGATDVAVVDRGGGPERVAAVAAAVPRVFGNAVAVPAADVADLDRQYIAPCGTDDACLVRTMASIAVGAIVFVEADAVVAIERLRLRSRRQAAPTTASLPTALDDAIHPERFGMLAIEGAPVGATVLVDGVRWTGGEVAAGQRTLVVEADGHLSRTLTVTVPPGGTTSVVVPLSPITRPPLSMTTPSTTTSPTRETPPLGVALTGVGAGVAAMGLAVGLLGEFQAAGVVAALRNGEARDDLGLWEAVELGGFAVAAIGAVVGAGGIVLLTAGSEGPPPSASGGG